MIERKKKIASHAAVYLLLIVGSVIMLLPFLWMVSTSLKERQNVFFSRRSGYRIPSVSATIRKL